MKKKQFNKSSIVSKKNTGSPKKESELLSAYTTNIKKRKQKGLPPGHISNRQTMLEYKSLISKVDELKRSHRIVLVALFIMLLTNAIYFSFQKRGPQQPEHDPYFAKTKKELSTKIPGQSKISESLSEQLRSYSLNNNFEEIIRLASSATKLNDDEIAFYMEALIARAQEDSLRHDEIRGAIKKELKNFKNSPSLLRTLGLSYLYSSTEIEKGLKILQNLLNQDPNNPFVLAYLGYGYSRSGQLKVAHQIWKRALNKEKNFVWVLEKQIETYKKEKRYIKALYQAERLSKIENKSYDGFIRLAEVYTLIEKKPHAVEFYRRALRLKNSAQGRLALGILLADDSRNQAIFEFKQGLKLEAQPQTTQALLFALAKNLSNLKRYKEASQALRAALRINPQNKKASDLLSEIKTLETPF